MSNVGAAEDPAAFVARLCQATNGHDLEAVVACFADTYENETPTHPARGFIGSDQVRKNWTQIFDAVPDVSCAVLNVSVTGDTVWSEWEHHGTRADGTPHHMRGVTIFGVTGHQADWARFYLEPVDVDTRDVDDAVRRQVTPSGPR